jgi:hypothetical protein
VYAVAEADPNSWSPSRYVLWEVLQDYETQRNVLVRRELTHEIK